MKLLWEVDDRTRVEAAFDTSGRERVCVNGELIHDRRTLRLATRIDFELPTDRAAYISVRPRLLGRPRVELRIGGQLFSETGAQPLHCAQCCALVKTNDRYCGKCGHTQPSAEYRAHERQVAEATSAIKALGVIYGVVSVIMFVALRQQATRVLGRLSGVDARLRASEALASLDTRELGTAAIASDATLTVGQLRAQLLWEPWGVLLINGILAAMMVALSLWGRRAPLPAVLVATATYAVVNVSSASADPMTIAQGLLLKLIMLGFLVKGIKAALALRSGPLPEVQA